MEIKEVTKNKKTMNDKDIRLLRKLLKQEGRNDLAELLNGSLGSVNESNQFGSYLNSVISSYEIHAPLDKYFSLKKLSESDKKIILNLILDIYPHRDEFPEIVNIDIRLLRDEDGETLSQEKVDSSPISSIRVFISYNHDDKVIAGRLRSFLENCNLEVFLAHEDISPSLEWQNVILQNLESIDIFIPLLSNNFIQSKWTDQETGFALAKNKFIIPVSIDDTNPYGFIGKFQSLKLLKTEIYAAYRQVVETIFNNEKYAVRMTNLLINSYEKSSSFDAAGNKLSLLLKIKKMNQEQIDKIINAAIENSQIRYSFKGRTYLERLLNKHKKFVNRELFEKLNSVTDDFKYNLS